MSEYQYIGFRAIDLPVSKENLEYMADQSSRATITPWRFDNEYHFGDFRGNVREMLRRGYDIHLHYANYGVRTLMIRFPQGLSQIKELTDYVDVEGIEIIKDKSGPGVILEVQPYFESGELPALLDLEELLDDLVSLRGEIVAGDLRPLYLLCMGVMCDDNHDPEEMVEPAVPAGLSQMTDAQKALAEFYGLDESMIVAAAAKSPPIAETDPTAAQLAWLKKLPQKQKDQWLLGSLGDSHAQVRVEMRTAFQARTPAAAWPTAPGTRTVEELFEAAREIAAANDRKKAAKAKAKRKELLAKMAANPQAYLKQVDQLVEERSTHAYDKASQMLADLREALAPSGTSSRVEKHAQSLRAKYPTRHRLTSALRKRGFIAKG